MLYMILGIIASGGGLAVGFRRREMTHQISVRRDLLFLAIMILSTCTIFALHAIDLPDDAYAAATVPLMCFVAFYAMGYSMSKPADVTYISYYDDDMRRSVEGPIVRYVKGDKQYSMEQTIRGAVRARCGIRDELNMDTSRVARYREDVTSNGRRRPIKLLVAASSRYDDRVTGTVGKVRVGTIKIRDENGNVIERAPKHLFHFPTRTVDVEWADCAETDPVTFDTSAEQRARLVKRLNEATELNRRLEVQLVSEKFDAAAEMIAGIFRMDLESCGNILNRLKEEFEENRQSGGGDGGR